MAFARADLDLVKKYFEGMFGCVVGCGCWEADWDSPEQLDRLLASGELDDAIEVLEALERLIRDLVHSDMAAVSDRLNVALDAAQDFTEFFGPSVDLLRAALSK